MADTETVDAEAEAQAVDEETRTPDPESVFIIWNTRDAQVAGGPFDYEDDAEAALQRVAGYSSGRVTDTVSSDAGEWLTVEKVTRKPIPEPEPEDVATDDAAPADDLESMTKEDLIGYAQERRISPANASLTKAELIASIRAAEK